MVTTVEQYNKDLQDVVDELRYKIQGFQERELPDSMKVYDVGKPVHILTNNSNALTSQLIDKGDYYQMLFPRYGSLQKHYTDDFAWIIDKYTVFAIERPYKGRVVKLLRKLLPYAEIKSIKNDVIINGYKIAPTCVTGVVEDFTKDATNQNSGVIYCLRWSNVEGLDKYFAGDPNHEERKASKEPMGSLDMFLTISKEEFIRLLEEQE
jgi:hypothetical protein